MLFSSLLKWVLKAGREQGGKDWAFPHGLLWSETFRPEIGRSLTRFDRPDSIEKACWQWC